MKRSLVVGLLLATVLLVSGSAFADSITFTVTGTFSASGTNVATFGSGGNTATLTYSTPPGNGTPYTLIGGTTNVSFGDIRSSVTGTGANVGGFFQLAITQSNPTGGSGNLTSVVTGTVQQSGSTGLLIFSFANTDVTIGGITYHLNATACASQPGTCPSNAGWFIPIIDPAHNSGLTSLDGSASVPEPASLALLGTGLLGIAGSVRRKWGK